MRIIQYSLSDRCAAALSLVLIAVSWRVEAARPMVTDDARIVDGKSCQLESWIKRNRDSSEYWALPACNFSGNLELTLGGAFTRGDDISQTSDVVLQGKTLFRPLQSNGWGSGLVFGADRHPAERASGFDAYVYSPNSFSFADDRFVLHVDAGWLRSQVSHEGRATWGVGSETQLTERTWFIAETFSQTESKPSYQLGLRHWLVQDRLQIDTTYGDRFGGRGAAQWFSVGLRLLSPPFLP